MINNSFYDDLDERWYDDFDHPIALLRAENSVRIPWLAKHLTSKSQVLDIGCGAGFLTNALAQEGHAVTGIDLSEKSLAVARRHDTTRSVHYLAANAYSLPFKDNSFDTICAMDILEHVEEPERLIAEASRTLKPGGLFFFHTFNRSLLSYFIVIKGIDWFVPNAPKHMHVYPLFIRPAELKTICARHQLPIETLHGFRPKLFSKPFWTLLFKRRISPDFTFEFCRSLNTGYCGFARKRT